MSTYIKRAVRYFLYLVILFSVIVSLLFATGYASVEIDTISALFESNNFMILIAVIVFFSALYPKLGYMNRLLPKIDNKAKLEEEFERIGIIKCKELGDVSYYRYKSFGKRLMTKFDDVFTIEFKKDSAAIDGTKLMVARVWQQIKYVTED